MQNLDRRSFTALSGLAALGAVVGLPQQTARAAGAPRTAARALRFAHFTDTHITPDRPSEPGMKKAFEAAQADGIEMILTGGDLIMDSFATKRAQVDREWALLHKLFAEHCKVPVEHCLGNHDILGWCRSKADMSGDEPGFGYARALSELKLAERWRSFDRNGWHFIVLSSVEPDPADECGYLARLVPEQLAWLEADLAKNTLPTVVVSHIPIVSVTAMMRGKGIARGEKNEISGGILHLDSNAVHALFRNSGKVKLVLSGHMHLVDRCEADGVTYACSGAISGGWWKPSTTYCDPCYGLVDLMTDGSFMLEVKPTGWSNA
jgi:3',5'-cyclic AMP phosphodiesterase CpdA